MSSVGETLNTRSSFVVAALVISWLAVVLLSLVVANLHFRLAHLEEKQPGGDDRTSPFADLVGRRLIDLTGVALPANTPLLLLLSSSCRSCDRLLRWLGDAPDAPPVALAWRDGQRSTGDLPPSATILDDGASIADGLGTRVAPFAVGVDADGTIVAAGAVGSVDSLRSFIAAADAAFDRPLATTNRSPRPETLKGRSS